MAKIIKLTEEDIAGIKKSFADALAMMKMSDGKINFTKTFGDVKQTATVFFSEIAWLKMGALIREFDKEVAWHGIAKRGEDPEKNEYFITDILVYPQEVTGATVTTDQEKYQMWLMSHDDDVFNNIRMQGHSHVTMSTYPSSVDTALYDRIIEQLEDDMFYIFMIWNKRGEKTVKIYDLAKNLLFDTEDCKIELMDDGTGLSRFLEEAKEMVKEKTYSYSSYGNQPTTNNNTAPEPAPAASQDKPKKKKGKRKNVKNKKSSAVWGSEDDNPYDSYANCYE